MSTRLPPAARFPDRTPRNAGPSIRCWSPRPTARIRLICLPHAGGGASSFRAWAPLLPPQAELLAVQYPGREDRYEDPFVDDMDELVRTIADDLMPFLDRPYGLFGHSMGSAVAWELTHELARRRARGPRRLFASGRKAPANATVGTLHEQSDDVLCEELTRLGGTGAEVLADPGLRSMVLGCVRNDYRLIETYRPPARPVLTCPVEVFTGDADPEFPTSEGEGTGGWAGLTTGPTRVHVFSGDHFYLHPRREEVVTTVLRRLDSSLASAGHQWPSTP